MGSRGPVPNPNSQRSKTGRNTLVRQPAREVDLEIVPPPAVAGRPEALAFWERNAPGLVDAGRLTAGTADSFALLSQMHADTVELADQLAAEGWITATDKGQAASPVARLLRDARRDFVALARDFGLTAASSARIPQETPDGQEEGDEEDQILKKLSIRGG